MTAKSLRGSRAGRDRWRKTTATWVAAALFVAALRCAASADDAAAPLHATIDRLVSEANLGIAAPIVGDAEFLRRVSLDLIGVPPSVDELRSFLADSNPDKRAAAIDRLLNHPRYARHMAEVFDVMLMERRASKNVSADEWHQYLLQAFRENRPYNQLAKEILEADGAEPHPRAAVRFYLDRQADPNLLTRDVGRIFFGRDMQCAQCHDHPIVDDYHQADYHGLLAFFSSGAALTAPAPDGKTYYVEKAGTDLTFESVFDHVKHRTGAKLFGCEELDEPALYPGDQYEVAPADGVRPVPKFSRRAKLAELATNGSNRAFNENIANRLWAHMMGRGLVDPVDFHHSANPPSNPALLKLLGEQLAASGFNLKVFWRELALTQTYQRSIEPPSQLESFVATAAAAVDELQQRSQALRAATSEADDRYTAAALACSAAQDAAAPVLGEMDQATAAAVQASAKLGEVKQQLVAAQSQVAAKTAVSQTLAEAVAKTGEVAKALPQDQELIAAAQKFAERQKQVVAELGALTADAEQKAAAVKAPEDAVAAARKAIDSVRSKLAPLAESVQQTDSIAVAARDEWIEDRTKRNYFEESLETVEQLAELTKQNGEVAAANNRVAAAEATVGEAQGTVDAQQAAVAPADQARQAMEQQVAQAAAVVSAAQAEYQRWQQLVATVAEALQKTDAARGLLPDDAGLTQASAALSTRLDSLRAEEQAPQQKLAEATAAQQTAQQQLKTAGEQHQAAVAEMAQRQQRVSEARQQLAAASSEAAQCAQRRDDAVSSLKSSWTRTFAVLPLKPLSPEQMCWSIFQVTGVYDRYVAAEVAEMDKAAPMSEEDKQDPAKVAARQLELQQRVYDKLKGNIGVFVSLYAPAAGQPQADFFASANQALFAANGGSVNSWIAPAAANVTERVIQQPDPKAAAEDLYLTVLSRMPDEAEVADVTQYLSSRPEEKAKCVQELVWGLLTSVEFRFNH